MSKMDDLGNPYAPDALRAAGHLTLLAQITAASVPLLMLLYHWLGVDAAAVAVLCAGAVMAGTPLLVRAGWRVQHAANLFLAALFALKCWLAVHLGGLGAATTAWFVLCPLVAALLSGPRAAIVWCALVFKAYVVLFLWYRFVSPFAAAPSHAPQVLAFAAQLGLLALVTIVALCFANKTQGQV
jgi:hypothetical protein